MKYIRFIISFLLVLVIGFFTSTCNKTPIKSRLAGDGGAKSNNIINTTPNDESDFRVTLTSDNSGVVISGYIGNGTDVVIPDTIQGMPVREIGHDAFVDELIGFTRIDKKLTRVVIPEGVTKIGAQAFRACNSLISVNLPSTLTEIGGSAFADLPLLSKVELPLGLKVIGGNAFSRCEKLTSIELPAGLIEIGSTAFEGTGLTSFPNPWPVAITEIPSSMFEYTNIDSVVIPEGITGIDSTAFGTCRKLSSITLPSTITYIGTHSFSNCSSLTVVNIPEVVQKLRFGYLSFGNCSNINLASQAKLRQLGYEYEF
jgi:hypothetical protein